MKPMSKEYTSESIQVLGDLAHIQARKGMYIGEGLDPRQLLSEIIDNAIDEVQAGFSDEFIVTSKSSRYCSISCFIGVYTL